MKRNSMAQALSQAAGHSFSRPPVTPVHPGLEAEKERESRTPSLARSVAPSRAGKKPVTGFFDPEVSRQIKKVALDKDQTMQELLQEAINDFFRKYDLPPIA